MSIIYSEIQYALVYFSPQHMSANQEIKVALASHLTDDPHSQIVSVNRFVRYPAYRYDRDNEENDIAILQFPKTIKFSRKLIPICLAERTFPAGYECVAAGWGHINSKFKQCSNQRCCICNRANSRFERIQQYTTTPNHA